MEQLQKPLLEKLLLQLCDKDMLALAVSCKRIYAVFDSEGFFHQRVQQVLHLDRLDTQVQLVGPGERRSKFDAKQYYKQKKQGRKGCLTRWVEEEAKILLEGETERSSLQQCLYPAMLLQSRGAEGSVVYEEMQWTSGDRGGQLRGWVITSRGQILQWIAASILRLYPNGDMANFSFRVDVGPTAFSALDDPHARVFDTAEYDTQAERFWRELEEFAALHGDEADGAGRWYELIMSTMTIPFVKQNLEETMQFCVRCKSRQDCSCVCEVCEHKPDLRHLYRCSYCEGMRRDCRRCLKQFVPPDIDPSFDTDSVSELGWAAYDYGFCSLDCYHCEQCGGSLPLKLHRDTLVCEKCRLCEVVICLFVINLI
jgi:hypothetical protein